MIFTLDILNYRIVGFGGVGHPILVTVDPDSLLPDPALQGSYNAT